MEYKTHVRSAKAGLSGEYVGRAYPCSRVFNRPGSKPRTNTGESRTMLKGIIVSAAIITVSVAPAYANCTQPQLAGGWRLYFQGHLNNLNFGLACTLIIGTTGIVSKSSDCADTLGRTTPVTGSLKLVSAQTCDYVGAIDLTAFRDINKIEQTTLSPDHNVLAGAGYDEPSTIGYAFTAVRIQ
jgi:hypothetical protein